MNESELPQYLAVLVLLGLAIVAPFGMILFSMLLGQRDETRLAEALTARLSPLISPFLIGALKKMHPIPATTVANAMVAAAAKKEDGETLYYYHEMQALLA